MTAARQADLLVDVVIVARDAAATLGDVLARLPRRALRGVVVVDRGSRDATARVAGDAGALVLREVGGEGGAYRRALAHLEALPAPPGAVVFLAADGGDDPDDLEALLAPIRDGSAELVIGVRGGPAAPEARVALGLIGLVYRRRLRDTGGPRAIRFPALVALGMRDRGAGWRIEMLVRSIALGLRIVEIDLGPGPAARRAGARDRVGAAGRALFHILRNATAR